MAMARKQQGKEWKRRNTTQLCKGWHNYRDFKPAGWLFQMVLSKAALMKKECQEPAWLQCHLRVSTKAKLSWNLEYLSNQIQSPHLVLVGRRGILNQISWSLLISILHSSATYISPSTTILKLAVLELKNFYPFQTRLVSSEMPAYPLDSNQGQQLYVYHSMLCLQSGNYNASPHAAPPTPLLGVQRGCSLMQC